MSGVIDMAFSFLVTPKGKKRPQTGPPLLERPYIGAKSANQWQ
jgi:hypothetical protein